MVYSPKKWSSPPASPAPQNSQPIGCWGRRERMISPIAGKATTATVSWTQGPQTSTPGWERLRANKRRVNAKSAPQSIPSDHASQKAVRRCNLPTPSPRPVARPRSTSVCATFGSPMSLLFRFAPNRFAECTLGGDALKNALKNALNNALGDAQIRKKRENPEESMPRRTNALVNEARGADSKNFSWRRSQQAPSRRLLNGSGKVRVLCA